MCVESSFKQTVNHENRSSISLFPVATVSGNRASPATESVSGISRLERCGVPLGIWWIFRGMFHVKHGVPTTNQLFHVKRRERMRSSGAYSAPPHVIGLCKLRKIKLDDIFFLFFACWCDDFSQQLNKLRWSNKSHLH